MVEIVTGLVMGSDGVASGQGAADDDENVIDAEAGWHFGFYSRPKDGARGVVLKVGGDGNTSILVCFRDKQYEMALEKGECGMQNAFGASVLLDKDGNVAATAADTAKFKANGDTYAMPKWDDFLTKNITPALPGTPYASLAGALGVILTALTTNCVNGAPLILPATPGLVNLTDFIARVAADEYKSTKATNG